MKGQPRTSTPTEAALAKKLGQSKPLWDALVAAIKRAELRLEWKDYGAKYGWQLKALDGKRAALYLVPHDGSFLAATALKGDALARLAASDLPPEFIRAVEDSRTLPEGKAARIEVATPADLAIAQRLLSIKTGA